MVKYESQAVFGHELGISAEGKTKVKDLSTFSENVNTIKDIKSVTTTHKGNFKHSFKTIPYTSLKIKKSEIKGFKSSLSSSLGNKLKKILVSSKFHTLLYDSVPLINADDVWKLQDELERNITGQGITIAIIDTGIDYTHPDLGGCFGVGCKVIDGYDFVFNDNDPMDDHGHGTHVAGTAAGNGTLKGVAPDANLIAYKVCNSGGSCAFDDIIAAIERAQDPNQDGNYSDHVDIISMSLGGPGDPDDEMSLTVDNVVKNGVIAVISAGNSGPSYKTIGSPGTARKAITVGASDKNDNVASFSSRGPTSIGTIKPDVVAPGVHICSAQWDDAWNYSKCYDNVHVAISGTSMAAPHVSGAVALMKQAHPNWTPDEIKHAFRNTAIDIDSDIMVHGYGRIDVLSAVQISAAPPIAELNTSGKLEEVTDITGTATGRNFKNYTLYYGGGWNPTSWTEIYNSTGPVVDGALYSGFDPSFLADGDYTLRLTVANTDEQISEDRTIIIIDKIKSVNPLNNDIFRLGDIVEINGSFKGAGFQNYTIEYGLGKYPSEWDSTGIDLVNGGLSQINGTLATWNTTSINETLGTTTTTIIPVNATTTTLAGGGGGGGGGGGESEEKFYSLKMTVNFETHQDTEYIRNIYLDSTLKEGWPQRINYESFPCSPGLPWDTCYYWAGYLEPVSVDINNDGNKEIIVYSGGDPPKLYAFNHDGSLLDDWPVILPKDYHPTLLMEDLDLDGNIEIVVKGNNAWNRMMTIVKNDGSILSQWNLTETSWGSSLQSTPAVGNFDDDPELEIVSAGPDESAGYDDEKDEWNNTGIIYIYNLDGSDVNGWPVYTDGIIFSSPVVADVNNDGDLEIIIKEPVRIYYLFYLLLRSNSKVYKEPIIKAT